MKILSVAILWLVACLATLAHADAYFVEGSSGEKLVLTDKECPYVQNSPLRWAYVILPHSAVVQACWGVKDENVIVIFADGSDPAILPIRYFQKYV